MTNPELLETIKTLSELLRLSPSHIGAADWLSKRHAMLSDTGISESEIETIKAELRKTIPGMGGLFDIIPNPPGASSEDRISLRAQKDGYVDRLYELTSPTAS